MKVMISVMLMSEIDPRIDLLSTPDSLTPDVGILKSLIVERSQKT